jgi:CYTH domain-containing protein
MISERCLGLGCKNNREDASDRCKECLGKHTPKPRSLTKKRKRKSYTELLYEVGKIQGDIQKLTVENAELRAALRKNINLTNKVRSEGAAAPTLTDQKQ